MKNEYYVDGDITHIILPTKKYGLQETIINTSDLELVSQYPVWHLHSPNKTHYAIYQPSELKRRSGEKYILMHRLILGNPLGKDIDHWDHNGLNNLRSNIFIVSVRQNHHNRNNGKKYTSVREWSGRFYSEIMINKWKYNLPMVNTERQAAFCYNMVCAALGDENIHAINLSDLEKIDVLSHLRTALQRISPKRNIISIWLIRGLVIFLKYNNFEKFTEYVLYAQSLTYK